MEGKEYSGSWLKVVETKPSLLVKAINSFKIGIDLRKYESLRKKMNALKIMDKLDIVKYEEIFVNNIQCCVLTPSDACGDKIIFSIHGGGFVLGDIPYCRLSGTKIAKDSGYKTVSVNYRLAPEFPFPAALEDVHAAYSGILEMGYSPSDIVLYGVSAGGGLCMSLCLKLKDEGKPLPKAIVAPFARHQFHLFRRDAHHKGRR